MLANARAVGLGADLNVHFEDGSGAPVPTEPAFVDFRPGRFPRPCKEELRHDESSE